MRQSFLAVYILLVLTTLPEIHRVFEGDIFEIFYDRINFLMEFEYVKYYAKFFPYFYFWTFLVIMICVVYRKIPPKRQSAVPEECDLSASRGLVVIPTWVWFMPIVFWLVSSLAHFIGFGFLTYYVNFMIFLYLLIKNYKRRKKNGLVQ